MKILSDIMTAVSDAIKETEVAMKQHDYHKTAEFKELSWVKTATGFRIFFEDKPLIEHPISTRVEHFESLPGLVVAARDAAYQAINRLNKEKIKTIQDKIKDSLQ